jgi:hypothetical protein
MHERFCNGNAESGREVAVMADNVLGIPPPRPTSATVSAARAGGLRFP